MSLDGFASIAMSSSSTERPSSLDVFRQFAGEEVADDDRDLWSLAFEREMTRFEQMDLSIRVVLPERLGAGGQEKWIVLAPHGQERRPLRTKIVLELGIESDFGLVVAE